MKKLFVILLLTGIVFSQTISQWCNLRADHYKNAKIVASNIAPGTIVNILNTFGDYSMIKALNSINVGKIGFISQLGITNVVSNQALVLNPGFNIWIEPKKNSGKVCTLTEGTAIEIINIDVTWYYVSTSNAIGWTYKDNIKIK